MLQSGTVVAQKYKIIQKIGSGGMSTVYLSEDIKLNKKWTVKEIKKSGGRNEEVNIRSLIAEANLIKKLDHPAIPRIVDIIETADTLFIVRDFVDGDPMDQVLRIYGAQPQASVVEWARELCDVLDYLHHQQPKIIYRDMKPANLMLVSDGSLRLIDFGIAREVLQDQEEIHAGTKGYAPPEQITAGGRTDERSDIYALGKTLYQLATGISPASAGFDPGRSVSDVNPHYSVRFSRIIEKCVQTNPDDRFQTCGELRYALSKLTPDEGQERKEKIRGSFRKGARILFGTGFVVSFLMALISASKVGQEVFASFFVNSGSRTIDFKTFFFVLALLFLVGYGVLRIHQAERKAEKKSVAVLHGEQGNYVVQQAQKGSMMDLLREAAITENPISWSKAEVPGAYEKPESMEAAHETDALDKSFVNVSEDASAVDETEVLDEILTSADDEHEVTDMADKTESFDAFLTNAAEEPELADTVEDETEVLDDILISAAEKPEVADAADETEVFDDILMSTAEEPEIVDTTDETEVFDDVLTSTAEEPEIANTVDETEVFDDVLTNAAEEPEIANTADETEVFDDVLTSTAEESEIADAADETEVFDDILMSAAEESEIVDMTDETEVFDAFLTSAAEEPEIVDTVDETEVFDDILTDAYEMAEIADTADETEVFDMVSANEFEKPEATADAEKTETPLQFKILHSEIVVHAEQTIELIV